MYEILNTGRVQRNIKAEVQRTLVALRDELKARSPVATGRYKQSWRYSVRPSGSAIRGSVFNVQPYGAAIEGGIPLGSKHPWAVSYKEGTNKKVVASQGKVWSSSAPGGTVNPVIGTTRSGAFANGLATRIADTIVRSL